ncbi:MAG: Nif3-like dinuclear metal center hexameric protein [Lachnospiraceae bacterium]|jgi:dinuclear metal center YbgI/SA1388 family protein|nr:Nif3-like dinuclear metal center hexameric protein [Lachnospiraceae bacterium]
MKCSDICTLIELEYSPEYACDWDNVGLLAGRRDKEVKKVLLALDATDEVIRTAVEGEADMLITHHPMIFSPIRRVTDEDMTGRRLISLIRHDISYYAMHTNYDTRGMADLAAGLLNLQQCTVLEEVKDGEGIGRVGILPKRMTLEECALLVKETFRIPDVRLFGPRDRQVYSAAICPGAGKSTMKEALRFGCDVYITGDIDHHTGIDAVDQGLCIIDAGHYGIEHIFMDDVRAYLEKVLTGVRMECVPVKHPFTVI